MRSSLVVLFVTASTLFGQFKVSGVISYKSAQSFYVRFETTQNLSIGDTVYITATKLAAGKIRSLSSQSAACDYISDSGVQKGEIVYVISHKAIHAERADAEESSKFMTKAAAQNSFMKNAGAKPYVRGRLGIRSFSSYSPELTRAQKQYWRYDASLRAANIGIENLDFRSSVVYGYTADKWNSSNFWDRLKVYDFFFSYRAFGSLDFQFGRIRNRSLYSLGTFDGVLASYSANRFSFGAFAGSHPDWRNMGINLKLFQYGLFVSRVDSLAEGSISNSISAVNQTNSGKTDRRFFYFKHRTRIRNISLYFSSEFDLYRIEGGVEKSIFSPTNIFASVGYRVSRKLMFDFSYDARKRIYYFETFKTQIDSILDTRTRQGFRASAGYQLTDKVNIRINGGFANQEGDVNPSWNGGAYVSVSRFTDYNFSLSGNFNYLQSSFLNGLSYGVHLAKQLVRNSMNIGFGLRRVDYFFATNSSDGVAQNIVSADLRLTIIRGLYLNAMFEFINDSRANTSRLFVGVSQSF